MKLLFIMHSMPVGGAERVLIDLLNNLDHETINTTLLVQYKEGELLPMVNKKVRVIGLYNYSRLCLFNKVLLKIVGILCIHKLYEIYERRRTRLITENYYDSIISFCQGHAHKLHSYIIDRSNNNISWIHSDLSKGNWGKGCFNNNLEEQENAYNNMNKLIFVSEGAKESFNKIFDVHPEINQYIIYNIVDKDNIIKTSELLTIPRPKRKFVFVNVGRLIEAKKQIRLLQAAKLLSIHRSDFIIWILGEGPLRSMLENYIRENNLSDIVVLWGNQMNPYAYVKASDAFILSSHQEGFSMVLCEALTLSKPVICTNIAGPREVLCNGKYGYLVNEDIDAIADAMNKFMSDASLYSRYSELANLRAKSFDVNDFMNSFYNLLA